MKPPKWYEMMHVKCIEPTKRKHGSTQPEWQMHRFPIKNGISFRQVMLIEAMKPNPLYEWIRNAQPRR